MEKVDKNYIKKGPQVIDGATQRTECGLLLVFDGDESKPGVIRESQDKYDLSTNFADLPELPSMRKEDMLERSLFTNMDQLSKISTSMVYDERQQMNLLKQKTVKVFKDELSWYNNQTLIKRMQSVKWRHHDRFKLPAPVPFKH